MEKTFAMIKPDGVKNNLIGEIIKRYEEKGLKVKKLRMIKPDEDLIRTHYPDEMAEDIGKKTKKAFEKSGKDFPWGEREYGLMIVNWLREFVASDYVVPMILEGEDAIRKVREITGDTEPIKAPKGTIRGDLSEDNYNKANSEKRAVANLVHASDSKENADREINLWFRNE